MAVFLFFGDDAYSHQEKLRHWQCEFLKKHGDMNTSVMNGGDVSANDIFQTCTSLPFLSEKRFTVVKDFLSEAKAEEQSLMADLLEKIPDFCILVFSEHEAPDRRTSLYKKLNKTAKLMDFPRLVGGPLLKWIEQQVTNKGGQIEHAASGFLAEVGGDDLMRLDNEIAKLVAYTDGRVITRTDIELLLDTTLTTSIFKLTDGIGHKDYRLALKTLHQLIDNGEELHRILSMIMRQIRIITCVKDLTDQGLRKDEIVRKMKEHPFVISNTMSQARNFTSEQLRRAYELLVQIDTKLKSGGIKVLAGDQREFLLAMDRLVIQLCA